LEQRLKEKVSALPVEQAIPRRAPSDSAPLSFAQQRLWFLNQLEPESPNYHQPQAFRLTGAAIDTEALQKALDQIVARHEALRTTFVAADGAPVQVIGPKRSVGLSIVDLRAVSDPDRDAEAQRLLVAITRRTFDLSQDLMLRALLLRLAEGDYILLLVTHHIASDGWSSGILWRELGEFYRAFLRGEPNRLPELPIQYPDYAIWQREWLQGELLERQLSYWKKQLDGLGAMQLPTDRPRPSVRKYQGKRQTIELSKQLSQKLRALSRQQGTTLFMTLLAAFQTLLYRYTGQEDIAVGCPIAGRTRQELEGLIGFFVNTLVMRINFSGNPRIRELLARVREVALGAYEHQDLPFEKLVEELQPERNLTHTPLFQVAFAHQNTANHVLEIAGVLVAPVEKIIETTKFDLHLSVNSAGEGIGATLYYATDLYDDVTIGRLLGHFRVLLEGMVADPDRRVSELPILTEGEEHQLLVEWNDTKRDYPKDNCIHQLFEEQVEKSPDAVAVVFENQQLTYRELNTRANQLGHYLQKQGVGPESLVGICVERSLEMVVGLLGILKAGGAYVPLDPEYPKERLAFMLEDARAPVLLTQRKLFSQLPEIADGRPMTGDGKERSSVLGLRSSVVCLDTDWEIIAKEDQDNLSGRTIADNLAYVIYTSGSTGRPKGVAVEHRQVANYLCSIIDRLNLTDQNSFATVSTVGADLGNTVIFSSLCTGGSLHVISRDRAADAEAMAEYFSRHPIDCLKIVPSHLKALQAVSDPERVLPRRLLIVGGETSDLEWVKSLGTLATG
jgi:non-ribosomal peptide synthetase component F